jgi:hypothetical protein
MIDNTQKRLREAQYFYRRLIEAAEPHMFINEPEGVEFCLNACLTAARSVSWTLGNEEKKKYKAWRPSWEAKLKPADKKLLRFTNKQRIAIVKRGAAKTKSQHSALQR